MWQPCSIVISLAFKRDRVLPLRASNSLFWKTNGRTALILRQQLSLFHKRTAEPLSVCTINHFFQKWTVKLLSLCAINSPFSKNKQQSCSHFAPSIIFPKMNGRATLTMCQQLKNPTSRHFWIFSRLALACCSVSRVPGVMADRRALGRSSTRRMISFHALSTNENILYSLGSCLQSRWKERQKPIEYPATQNTLTLQLLDVIPLSDGNTVHLTWLTNTTKFQVWRLTSAWMELTEI